MHTSGNGKGIWNAWKLSHSSSEIKNRKKLCGTCSGTAPEKSKDASGNNGTAAFRADPAVWLQQYEFLLPEIP